jgi:endonuclease YncB( thermonuclease family)
MRPYLALPLLLACVGWSSAAAADTPSTRTWEAFSLRDGRVLEGYEVSPGVIMVRIGGITAEVRVKPQDITDRRPIAAPADPPKRAKVAPAPTQEPARPPAPIAPAAAPGGPTDIVVPFVSIQGGDRITVLFDGKPTPVQLLWIDTPDYDAVTPLPSAQAARDYVETLLRGRQDVRLWSPTPLVGGAGPLRALVLAGEISLNDALIENGFSPLYERDGAPPASYRQRFVDAEVRARTTRAGLWSTNADFLLERSSLGPLTAAAPGGAGAAAPPPAAPPKVAIAKIYLTNGSIVAGYKQGDRYFTRADVDITDTVAFGASALPALGNAQRVDYESAVKAHTRACERVRDQADYFSKNFFQLGPLWDELIPLDARLDVQEWRALGVDTEPIAGIGSQRMAQARESFSILQKHRRDRAKYLLEQAKILKRAADGK